MNGRWDRIDARPARARIARGRARAIVGLKIFHTVGDSERATRQINTEMEAILDSVYSAMGVDRSSLHWGSMTTDQLEVLDEWKALTPEEKDAIKTRTDAARARAQQSPYWGFFQAVISPVFADWSKFVRDEKFYALFTSWEEYEKWLERVRMLRATVEAKGIGIESPKPADLTQTFQGEALETAKRGLGDIMSMAKVAIYGALAIVGVVAVSSVVHSVRTGRDPADKFSEFAKEHRR